MGTGDVLSGFQPVYESERSRVTRASADGRVVIRKEPLGPDAERRLRHEAAILERLRGVVGVAQVLEATEHPPSIVMADAGATTAAGLTTPLDVDELPALAVALARAVAGMHARGVMHRDLSPANIVVSADGEPCLISFGLATTLAEIRPEITHHAEMAATPAYVAPEQTGRTARSVDHRADLYALGAILYELATGAPPFGTGDPLRLTHDHLARKPTPPAIPAPLSEIILRLLEKEPDRRYQSAAGLLYDLERASDGTLRIGTHDVPRRLRPPSRLAGRDAEVAALEQAFADALTGACRGILVAGASGVGKSALIDELRPAVTGAGGWFVAGKFDQYRSDLEFDAINQALRALGRLLLAEPEADLAALRARILAGVGANAALLTAIVPEFAALLGVPPDAGDPLTAQPRTQRMTVEVLRAVASRERPLAVVVDDLQWAGRTPVGAVELVLTEASVDGLLLVGAYRDGALDAPHPLAGLLSRRREQTGVQHLRLENLSTPSLATMVADMLQTDEAAVAGLVEAIEPPTRGNPYDAIELLDALRRDGVLTAMAGAWRWDATAVRAHLGEVEGRVEAVPAASRELLEAMACLGGRVEPGVLSAATGEPTAMLDARLAPALEEGLLAIEPGTDAALRFRHDRIREAILEQVDAPRRATLQLAMARRLARVPEHVAAAAEQYLPVAGEIADAEERQTVVALLRRAAEQAALIGDYARVDALLAAALPLADAAATVAAVRTGRHAALFGLGRLDEADEEYRAIERLYPAALDRTDATAVQVRSLSHRLRFAEAIDLGLEALRECGIAGPAVPSPGEPDRRFEALRRWVDGTDVADEPARPELTDPGLLAASRLIDAVLPVGYFVPDPVLIAWLGLEALRIWTEHGPSATLVGPISHAAYHAGLQTGDVALGYRALRRVLELGEAHGYEPATSQARHMYAAVSCWFEPIEHGARAAQRAREGLIAGADLAYAGYTYQLAVPYLVDCAPSLARFATEVDEGLAFLHRTGDEQTGGWLDGYHWLALRLRGETTDAFPVDRYADNPLPLLYAHLNRALAAAIFGETAALAEHTAAMMPLLAGAAGSYATAVGHVLRGLAVAEQARATDGDERAALLSELDEAIRWLAARAADAPDNFLHLLQLIEAEREWTAGDFRAALLAFDAARREVAPRQRPWHRALIAEHAARFHVAHGLEHAAHGLLAEAREAYRAWGATAKVAQLDWANPALGPRTDAGGVTTGTIDLLGIVSASQALSSETSFGRLHARVVHVLGAITGATRVDLLLLGDGHGEWLRPAPDGGGLAPIDDADAPASVLRYTQRIGEPLLVADATSDSRFARDPYFAGVEDGCSLLAVPIISRGTLRAALVLENRLIRGAFSAERLEAVKLISGQLAVSLDNAGLYAELSTSRARLVAAADDARRRIGRDLHDGAQQRLVQTILALKAAQQGLRDDTADVDALLAAALDTAERAMSELRELAHGILPSVLTHGGLRAGVRALASRLDVPVDVDVGSERLPPEVEASVYFIVAEALTNVVKHARASRATVRAAVEDGLVALEVRDNGVGGADPGGRGLVGIADRVDALGGRLRIDSAPGAGTRVSARLPLPPRP